MRLGDLCKTAAGGTPLKSKKEFYEGGVIPWLVSGEVNNKNITSTKRFITQLGLDGSSAKVFPENTVVIAMYGATAGEVGILKFPTSTNQAVCGIYPNETVLPEYVYYFFLSHKSKLVAQAVGNAQPNISQQKIKDTYIDVPPIPEQQRIVAILDQAFVDIEKARANAEKNLKNARELFDSYLNQVFSQRGEGWVDAKLADCSTLITKGSSPKWQGISYVESPGVLFVTSENVGSNEMLFNKTKYVEDAFNEKDSKSVLQKGDVLTNIVGASIGRTAIYDRDDIANINQAVCMIRCDSEKLSNEYLAYLLNSPYLVKVLHDNEIDNARANLSLGFFRGLEIPLPSLEEQTQLVSCITEFKCSQELMHSLYKTKLASLDELKKSLLQKAFSGELTKTEGYAA